MSPNKPAAPATNLSLAEDVWEQLALDELAELAWEPLRGKAIFPDGSDDPDRRELRNDLVIPGRLKDAIRRLNPQLPESAVEAALRAAIRETSNDALAENERVHGLLVRGIREVEYRDEFGEKHNPLVRLINFKQVEKNDFRAVNQVIVRDGHDEIRFDVVLYVNGMPLAFIELKKASDPEATTATARQQLANYRDLFPSIFRFNLLCLVSDGISARYGTAFGSFEHYAPWNVDHEGNPIDTKGKYDFIDTALGVALHGLFDQARFLQLLHHCVNFAGVGDRRTKRIAKAHQYFAVTKSTRAIVRARRGDGRAGVIWHTQGSGKSEEMVLTAALTMRDPALGNPTIVVVTDRIDLDDQLYNTFDQSSVLPEKPTPIGSREELREKLASTTTGGIFFTVLQKFGLTKVERESGQRHPLLSNRSNVILMVDEAHRSHYDNLDGFARHIRDALPNATFIAFTGTPLSTAEKNTRDVFGPHIDVYDLRRAVEDGATVRVMYDNRRIELGLSGEPEDLDEKAEDLLYSLDPAQRQEALSSVAVRNLAYKAPSRIDKLAADIVAHWEERSELMKADLDGSPGKAMIVCVDREACVRIYDAITALRPNWAGANDDKGRPRAETGKIRVVYSGKNDDESYLLHHHYTPSQLKVLQRRAKDANDELEILIVCDMLLTGYDAPPLHTMYMDKPLRGANLMQAIARVNRRFAGKQDGLLVGYAPLAQKLKDALVEYSTPDHDEQADPTLGAELSRAISQAKNHHENLCRMLYSFDWRSKVLQAKKAQSTRLYLSAVLALVDHLRAPENQWPDDNRDGKPLAARFRTESWKLARYYKLCSTKTKDLAGIIDDIKFFGEVRGQMLGFDTEDRIVSGLPTGKATELLLRELAEQAIEAGGITDLYATIGLGQLDLSHLDAAYIKKMQESANPHLQAEALRRLVQSKMRETIRGNKTRERYFSEELDNLMKRYRNESITSAEVIAELVAMAKDIVADPDRGANFTPRLDSDQLAFYDAVASNDSAIDELGTDTLAQIARDLVEIVRRDRKTDWAVREEVRAKLRASVKRLLRKYKYPPDKQEEALDQVMTQVAAFAESLGEGR